MDKINLKIVKKEVEELENFFLFSSFDLFFLNKKTIRLIFRTTYIKCVVLDIVLKNNSHISSVALGFDYKDDENKFKLVEKLIKDYNKISKDNYNEFFIEEEKKLINNSLHNNNNDKKAINRL